MACLTIRRFFGNVNDWMASPQASQSIDSTVSMGRSCLFAQYSIDVFDHMCVYSLFLFIEDSFFPSMFMDHPSSPNRIGVGENCCWMH